MDHENFTPNILLDDESEEHDLPHDLDLDIWFHDPDISEFLDSVRSLKRTRALDKADHPGVVRARTILEAKMIGNSSLIWHLRFNTWFIRKMGRRTTTTRAAHLYTRCLEIAVQDALKTTKGSRLTEDEIRQALRSDSVRQYLLDRKDTLDDEIEILYRSKRSLNASAEDNDNVEELYSTLETHGPDDSPPSSSSMPVLDLSSDEAVEAFELTAENKVAFLDALKDAAVMLRFCRLWVRRLDAYFSRCLTSIPEHELEQLRDDAVHTLMQMKAGPRTSTANTDEWRHAVAASGLSSLLMRVTRTEFMLDWQRQAQTAEQRVLEHVLHSLCYHQWAEALAIIFDSWTPLSAKTADAIAAAATYPITDPGLELHELKEKYVYSFSPWLRKYIERREQRARTKFEKNKRNNNKGSNKHRAKRQRTSLNQTGMTEEFVLNTNVTIGEQFLGFLGDHPEILPSRYNMQAYFLFLDRPHFLRNFHQWIRAALLLFKLKVTCDSDIDNIYSTLMNVDFNYLKGLGEDSEKLYLLFSECKRLRELVKPTSNVTLKNLENKQEVTVIRVTALDQAILDGVEGSAFTFHESNQVQPKATRKKDDGTKAKDPRPAVNFVDPREAPYHLKRVRPNRRILKKYHKHVFIFIEKDTNILVGGVIFGAFDPDTLQRSLEHHILVSRFPGLRRGASFLEFAYGKMVPVGFRVPAGGRPGDEYGPHPVLLKQADLSQRKNNNNDINMMFAHAEDIETMFSAVADYVPEVVRSIRDLSDEDQLKDMGSSGVSSYYCSNYMSPQHKDADVGWSLCSQLYKDLDTVGGDAKKDFNFAFTKWGLYVETRANCVCGDLHGTIMPTNTTVNALFEQAKLGRRAAAPPATAQRLRGGAGSDEGSDVGSDISNVATAGSPPRTTTGSGGTHVTNRKKDANRARRFAETQRRTAARDAYWQGRE
ncbi:hypothetical protein PENSPDRAFT_692119 [Peniophora sp. CONT]|nr:hypothetical protein PENSPDRAFT_692119 [Peniophora sp. CONT]